MKMSEQPVELPIPAGHAPLNHQLAGHRLNKPEQSYPYGMLKANDDCILKPLIPSKVPRELAFYDMMASDATECDYFSIRHEDISSLALLKPYLPDYYGTVTLPEHPNITYLRLGDLTKPFVKPTTIDVKIGQIPSAPHKANTEQGRLQRERCPYLDNIKFQLLGTRMFDTSSKEWICELQHRKLDPEQVLLKGFMPLFRQLPKCKRSLILDALMDKLEGISQWFDKQTSLSFYGSSIFMVFESDVETLLANAEAPVEVRMIDFTHVHQSTLLDQNYIEGLSSLISYFHRIIEILKAEM